MPWSFRTKFKKRATLFVTVSALLCLSFSCKELLDVKRSFTFTQEFTLSDLENLSFSVFEVVDMSIAETLIADYGSKIKAIEIEELKFWLKNHEGPEGQTLTNLDFSVARADGSNVTNIVSLGEVLLANIVNTPTVAEVNNEGIALASELMKNFPHKLKFMANGTLNEGPISFTVVFELKIKMTANPLNK